MAKYKNKYRIEPNRWQYWDYSAPADYFITIVTKNRVHDFGTIENGSMQLSKYGKIVEAEFLKINQYHQRAKLDEYIIMPNHVHCIITLMDYDENQNDTDTVKKIHEFSTSDASDSVKKIHEFSLPRQRREISVIKQDRELTIDEIKQYRKIRRNMVLIKILGKFKQQTSKQINIVRNSARTKNWQAGFHDHVIRNDREYQYIKNYIITNPMNWDDDTFS